MAMDEVVLRRLRWRCRRGLLENDLMLGRFLDRHADRLDERRVTQLQALLEFEDHDLWDVLAGRAECSDPALQDMVELIRAG
ncbi:MAG TPA: succinate dehydrogenase assembly factor 2 [Burkholderiales bacterium]|nr:succinate dehydrogenase assembly factor 2 [Burkholderiales bacterium]